MASNLPKVTPSEFQSLLRRHFAADEPLCVLSGPGMGKTEMVKQASQAHFGVEPISLILGTLTPSDLQGIPTPDHAARRMVFYPPEEKLLPTEPPACLFCDEIDKATPVMQGVSLNLFDRSRRAGAIVLKPGVGRVVAGNRPEDKSGGGRIIAALADRCDMYELQVSTKDWAKWAVGKVDERVIGYLRFQDHEGKEALCDWDANRAVNATPRSWERLSRVVLGGEEEMEPGRLRQVLMAGIVGEGQAAQVESFLGLYKKLPLPEDVLKNPEKAPVFQIGKDKDAIALTFALCGALAQRITKENGPAMVTYASRLQAEFGQVLISDAGEINATAVTGTLEYQKWVKAHPEMFQ